MESLSSGSFFIVAGSIIGCLMGVIGFLIKHVIKLGRIREKDTDSFRKEHEIQQKEYLSSLQKIQDRTNEGNIEGLKQWLEFGENRMNKQEKNIDILKESLHKGQLDFAKTLEQMRTSFVELAKNFTPTNNCKEYRGEISVELKGIHKNVAELKAGQQEIFVKFEGLSELLRVANTSMHGIIEKVVDKVNFNLESQEIE